MCTTSSRRSTSTATECAAAPPVTSSRWLGIWACTRGLAITLHSVPEVQYDDSWHLVDGSLMNYFLDPEGRLASVAEIKKAVQEWHSQHPGYRQADGKLREFAAHGGWKKGPPLLCSTGELFWDANGINAAGWHGWPSTMQEYDCKEFKSDYGGSMGYELNVELHKGERLVRNWSNKGLHVNMLEGEEMPISPDASSLAMCRRLGNVAPGRIGNGTLDMTFRCPAERSAWEPSARTIWPLRKRTEPRRPSTSRIPQSRGCWSSGCRRATSI